MHGLTAIPLAAGPLGRAWAQDGRIPVEEFFRPTNMSRVQMAPDGKHVLAIRPHRERLNLWVFEIASRRWKIITNYPDADVTSPRWISNDRIIYNLLDRSRGSGDQMGSGGLFAVDKDGSNDVELAERGFLTEGRRLLPASTTFHSKGAGSGPDEILVSIWSTEGSQTVRSSNVHRLNTRTGRSTLITLGGPGRVVGWIFDQKAVARVALSMDDRSTSRIHYRASADAPWQVLAESRFDDPTELSPLALADEGHVYVLARVDSDFRAVHRMEIAGRKVLPEPVAAIKGYDLGPEFSGEAPVAPGDPLIFGGGSGDEAKLVGIRYHAERRGVYWIEEEYQALQQQLEQSFPGKLVSFQGDPRKKDRPLLVTVASDAEPPRYLLLNATRTSADGLGSAMPWIRPERMGTTETLRYKARDGLSIPATLTIPRGAQKKNLPLVVLHYGGPWVRAIQWGFDPRVQFLASRGYAVFMPAPRASTGYGWKHFQAGWKQWGLGMQDDVADGVRHLIAEGIVDAKRVCIAGASYGGYMTMMGLAKEPQLYRCGINWVGVTDPELMYVEWTDFAAGTSREVVLPVYLGHPKTDAEQFARTSPVKRAAEIKQPVLMAYGGSDRRVPIVNGEKMRDALSAHNPNVEWVVYGDEGHNFQKLETQLDFWGRVERFLAKNLS